ncbi:hypothetical protein IM511_09315 [Erythrobacteraceae bacterium E2-1 Yellow Sea]|nr:hypothetical protein [Erythrobacteraceae bacterium E2-1 Yellow Sea]
MPGFGYGLGLRKRHRLALPGETPVAVEAIEPSASWTGVAASGYSIPPSDPARVTAKPACRLIVVPNQYFTDELLVGVYAGANNGGSLYENMGLSHVRVYCEGNVLDIPAPSVQIFPDANGNQVSCFGWWAKLKKPVGISGHAHVYFEAVPSDATMQNRVIGPFQFSPQELFAATGTIHDYELEVAASQTEIAGVRYKTIYEALRYLALQLAENPRITVTEAGTYDLQQGHWSIHAGSGFATIQASAPITIGRNNFTVATAALPRTKYDGLHFKGSNITFDMKNMDAVYPETASTGRDYWFDGIVATNSGGRGNLWAGGPRIFGLCRFKPWFTECSISTLPSMVTTASLVRGCQLSQGYFDCATDADCVIGNRVEDWDSVDWLTERPAFSVQYTGTGASATLELSGSNDASSRTFTAKVNGSNVGTFTVQKTEAAYAANTNYTIQNVVDWLNGLTDWSASVIDNTYRATACSLAGLDGSAFAATDVKSAPLNVVTIFSVHPDFWQLPEGLGTRENVIVADNKLIDFAGQKLFLSAGSTNLHDALFINNAAHDKDIISGSQNKLVLSSQAGKNSQSHVIVAHNSMMQNLLLRSDLIYNPDSYCIVSNNVFRDIDWVGSPNDPDLTISGNHLFIGADNPSGAAGTSIGGDETSLYSNVVAGNFAPKGDLLANRKPPVLKYDINGNARAATSPVGALR